MDNTDLVGSGVQVSGALETIAPYLTKIAEYTKKANDIGKGGFNKMAASVYLRDFIVAMDITNLALLQATVADGNAENRLKQVRSIAFMDKAEDYLKANNMKDSNGSREKYEDMDPDVIRALDARAQTNAMVTFLKNKLQIFRMTHDDIKKIAYGDQYLTPDEGM